VKPFNSTIISSLGVAPLPFILSRPGINEERKNGAAHFAFETQAFKTLRGANLKNEMSRLICHETKPQRRRGCLVVSRAAQDIDKLHKECDFRREIVTASASMNQSAIVERIGKKQSHSYSNRSRPIMARRAVVVCFL
jgi:hypothetical protein